MSGPPKVRKTGCACTPAARDHSFFSIQKEIVGVQCRIAEELIHVAMEAFVPDL